MIQSYAKSLVESVNKSISITCMYSTYMNQPILKQAASHLETSSDLFDNEIGDLGDDLIKAGFMTGICYLR